MIFKNYRHTVLLCALAAVLALTGCQKTGPHRKKGASIRPSVASVVTKGQIMQVDSLKNDADGFIVNGYLSEDYDTTVHRFIQGKPVVFSGEAWDWKDAVASGSDEDRPDWLENVASRFWSYYPSDMADLVDDFTLPGNDPSDDEQMKVSFTYVEESAGRGDDGLYHDAELQKDLIFAFNEQTFTGSNDQISINFHHALAAVNFDITTMDNSVEFGTEITLEGVRFSGNCTVTGDSSDNSVSFDWSDDTADTDSFAQSFDKDEDFETVDSKRVQKIDGYKTFFMVPQTLTDDTKITIAFIFQGGSVPIRRTVSIGKNAGEYVTWQAGYIYTYRITVNPGDYSLLDFTLTTNDWVNGSQEVSF